MMCNKKKEVRMSLALAGPLLINDKVMKERRTFDTDM